MASGRLTSSFKMPHISSVLMAVAMTAAAGMLLASYLTRMTPHEALKNGDPVDRVQAVEELIKLGRDGVPELVYALQNYNRETRMSALFGLGRIGSAAEDAVDVVLGALADPDKAVRSVAVGTYWQIQKKQPLNAINVLLSLCEDPSEDVRQSVESALEELGERDPQLLIRLIQERSNQAGASLWPVLRKIAQQGSAPELAPAVHTLLGHSDRAVHDEALYSIVSWDQARVTEIQELLKLKEQPFRGTSISGPTVAAVDAALRAMTMLGPEIQEMFPDVLELLNQQEILEVQVDLGTVGGEPGRFVHEIHERFQYLLTVLSKLQGQARPAVAPLLSRLNEIQPSSQVSVTQTLVDIGADSGTVVPVLVQYLAAHIGEPEETNWFRLGRLNEKGPLAASVLSKASPEQAHLLAAQLLPQLRRGPEEINKTVLNVLTGFGECLPRETVPLMIPLISHPDREIRSMAIDTVSKMGSEAAPAVGALIDQLEGKAARRDPESSRRIVKALGQIGPVASEAVPTLLGVLNDPDAYVEVEITDRAIADMSVRTRAMHWDELFRLTAISSLGKIGVASPRVIEVLELQSHELLADRRVAAAKALRIASTPSKKTLTGLIELLEDEIPSVRVQAALTLGNLSGDRSAAVNALDQLLVDKNPYVRQAAILTLGKIGPDANSALPHLTDVPPERVQMDSSWYARMTGRSSVPSWFDETPDFPHETMEQAVKNAIAAITGERN